MGATTRIFGVTSNFSLKQNDEDVSRFSYVIALVNTQSCYINNGEYYESFWIQGTRFVIVFRKIIQIETYTQIEICVLN